MTFSLSAKTLLTGLSVICLTSALHAAPVLSENFDSLTPMLTATSAGSFSAINGTNVDIVGGSLFGYLCVGPESGNCIDLGGSGGNAVGQFASSLSLAAGTYNLSFDLIGSGRGQDTSTTVTFGDYSQTFLLSSGDITSGVVVNQTVTVPAGTSLLEFVNNGGGNPNIGALLDNVTITPAGTAVTPEPGTLTLLATGLFGAAGAVRRRLI